MVVEWVERGRKLQGVRKSGWVDVGTEVGEMGPLKPLYSPNAYTFL